MQTPLPWTRPYSRTIKVVRAAAQVAKTSQMSGDDLRRGQPPMTSTGISE
ncbi:hypothetical protein [Streptomyces sp. NPDC013187]